ncbi:MAG: 2-phospho-L-lactate transferase CofD family protein, partial [Candidatus Hodarchaeota archaeon]
VDKEKGCGFNNETFNCLSVLKKFYNTGWFHAGDKDLAIHIYRTDLFRQGFNKAKITNMICQNLGVKAHIIPMCNERVETFIRTATKSMHFEEYFIKYQCKPEVLDIEFKGIENAVPVKGVKKYIENARKIIICPSNPIVSIGTILQVKGIKQMLSKVKNRIIAISPIIEGTTVKGPADVLMKCVGLEVSSMGVAKFYEEFLGTFIIDNKDAKLKSKIEELRIKTYCYDTLMTSLQKKINLAKFVMNL